MEVFPPFRHASDEVDRNMSRVATKVAQVLRVGLLPLRTLIVDDSREFLSRIERWLATQPSLEIVGRAYSGFEALKRSRECRPDLVVMDVAMPLMNGYEAAARIKEHNPRTAVILISFFARTDVEGENLLKADAYLMKDSLHDELFPTVARLFPQLRYEAGPDHRAAETELP